MTDLTSYGQGKLSGEALEQLDRHIANCESCARQLDHVSDDSFIRVVRQADGRMFLPARSDTPAPQPLTTADVAEDPTHLGNYQLLERLGQGGMGTVFRARDTSMDRVVAVKLINAEGMADPEMALRFKTEVRAAAKLEHGNIVRAYHADLDGGTIYLVMELIDGVDLDRLVRKKGPLPITQATHLARQAAQGLQHAHEMGLVHRDIKPKNLMVTRKGVVKILDFGLAKVANNCKSSTGVTAVDMIMGTPHYIAPEQSTNAREVDIRADLYSLGCTLWFLLTGQPPFPGENPLAVILAHHEHERPWLLDHRPDAPESLARLLRTMMAKEANARLRTPADVASALQPFAAGTGRSGETSRRSVPPRLPTGTPGPSAFRAATAALPVLPSGDTELSPISRPAGPARRGPSWKVCVGGFLASLSGVLLTWIVLTVIVGHEKVVLEINEADARVSLDGKHLTIRVPGEAQPIEIEVRPGEHLLEVSKDGFSTQTRRFTYRKGTKEIIKVRLEPLQPAGEADRKAAEYVLAQGGRVRVDDEDRNLQVTADLPREAFRLRYVDLENRQVNAAGLALLARCAHLKHLWLQNTNVRDSDLAPFRECRTLKALCLNHTRVGDTGVAHFANCKDLKVLNLFATQVTDAGLAHFEGCKGFTGIDLSVTRVTDAGLARLKHCEDLDHLRLFDTRVGDAGLASFQKCKNLVGIDLRRTRVTDAGLALLSLDGAQWLELADTQVTDAALERLGRCKELKLLGVQKTRVSPAGVDRLKKALPGCRVLFDPQPASGEPGFVPLFNGKDLTGWLVERDDPKTWTAENGMIVAHGSTLDRLNFLLTHKEYADFVLRLEFSLGDHAGSAVVLRGIPGERVPTNLPQRSHLWEHPVLRLEDQPTRAEVTGTLHWLLSHTHERPNWPAELSPPDAWNDLEIEMKGRSLRATLNGKRLVQTSIAEGVRFWDGSTPGLNRAKGRIGLQKHHGIARFRNLRIKELPAKIP